MPRNRLPTLSRKESLILALLVERDQMYGLELVAASPRQLKRGTVYVTLGRMEDKGYVASRLEDTSPSSGGLPRRIYRPTPFGRRVQHVWAELVTSLVPKFAPR
jgi:DNA-binding PadR family transcriptional regulator